MSWCSGVVGSSAISQLQCLRLNPELGLLTVWSFSYSLCGFSLGSSVSSHLPVEDWIHYIAHRCKGYMVHYNGLSSHTSCHLSRIVSESTASKGKAVAEECMNFTIMVYVICCAFAGACYNIIRTQQQLIKCIQIHKSSSSTLACSYTSI